MPRRFVYTRHSGRHPTKYQKSTNEPLDPTFLRQRKMKQCSSTSAAAAVILQLLKSLPTRTSPLIVLNLLGHDPSCPSCPYLPGKVQLHVWLGKVVVSWRHLAIPNSTILANFDSNSHSKAEVSVPRLNHWPDSKIPATHLLPWTVLVTKT